MRLVILVLVFFLSATVNADTAFTPVIRLKISGHVLSAEVAHTQMSRSQGLMYRQSMEKNHGMLFVFPVTGRHSMWMVNTPIPLSVAFIDEKGIILNIADMVPHTETVHSSVGAAKYAVETNFGWFRAKGIKAGNRIIGLGKAPQAE